jgi:ATP-binding cassette subfamily F protein 3
VFESQLAAFEGTILMATHDRHLAEALADEVWWIDRGKLLRFDEGWGAFQYARHSAAGTAVGDGRGNSPSRVTTVAGKPNAAQIAAAFMQPDGASADQKARAQADRRRGRAEDNERRRADARREALEAEIAALDARLIELRAELERATEARDVERLTAAAESLMEAERAAEERLSLWLGLE